MKPYRKSNVPLASELRQSMTKHERLLWYRYLRTAPVRFQRQKPIGRYIVDFYCAKARLVIELDGSGHYEEAHEAYDRQRTAYLERMGLKELRYTNLQIAREFRNVCEDIYRHIEFAVEENDISGCINARQGQRGIVTVTVVISPPTPSSEGAVSRLIPTKPLTYPTIKAILYKKSTTFRRRSHWEYMKN